MEERHAGLVLAVDDDDDSRLVVSIALQALGYDVREAVNAEEAEIVTRGEHPDAIVLDICLPGKSGLDFLEELRAGPDSDTPVVVCSALVTKQAREDADRLGADGYLEKPYRAQALIDAVESVLVKARGAPGAPRRRGCDGA